VEGPTGEARRAGAPARAGWIVNKHLRAHGLEIVKKKERDMGEARADGAAGPCCGNL